MSSAQEMVGLSRKLADRIRDGQGAISADETVEFKSLLLSMGISNPVTKQTAGSLTKYHKELCKELATFLQPLIKVKQRLDSIISSLCCSFVFPKFSILNLVFSRHFFVEKRRLL